MPWLRCSLTLMLLTYVVVTRAQDPPATSILMTAREALGGDAALSKVRSVTVSGSLTRDLGHTVTNGTFAYSFELPDKFLHITRVRFSRGPLGMIETAQSLGFNGGALIQAAEQPDLPEALRPPPRTPAQRALSEQRALLISQREFIAFVLPLFGAAPTVVPLQFASPSRQQSNSAADSIDVVGPDGFTWHLFLDPTTHLPSRLTWMAKPLVLMSTTSLVTVAPGGRVMARPGDAPMSPSSNDPTVGMPDVEWQLAISEYRISDGLNWPHRLTTSYGGRKYDDLKLGNFKINSSIDTKTFRPRTAER
ncbi:MAG: hypothetical protein ABI051_19115 [Vicinamibacterales bacterium]